MTEIAGLEVVIGADITDLQSKMGTANTQVNTFGDKTSKAISSAKRVAVPVAGVIAAIGLASFKVAVDFESNFADVIKTVSGTTEELDSLKATIRNMATEGDLSALDDAHTTLTKIAAVAGQLGVATSDIEEFTRVVGGMTVATDLSAEGAAVFFARFSNITGMPIDDITNLADAIVTLGNNSAAQESEITAVANRLASLSSLNFEVDEILGLSAAIASLGLSPELGSSNVIKTITDMTSAAATGSPKLKAYADTVGLTADEFADLVANDPSAAFDSLLASMSKMDASEMLSTLDSLGIKSSEQQRTLLTLAGGYDTVAASMETADVAFKGNGALMAEVGAKASTTAGEMNTFKNNVNDLGISLGEFLLPAANKVATGLTDMVQGLNDGDLDAAVTGATDALGGLLNMDLTSGLQSWGQAFQDLGKIVALITDDISRRFKIMNLDVQIFGLEAQLALQNILPEGLQDQDFILDLKVALGDISAEREGFDVADRINDFIVDSLKTGDPINLDDMVDLGEGLGVGFGDLMMGFINFDDTDQFSEALKLNLGEAFANALSEGDTGTVGQLMEFTDFMSFDPNELNTAIREAMAIAVETQDTDLTNQIYHIGLDLIPDADLVKFNEDLTAMINQEKVKADIKALIKLDISFSATGAVIGIKQRTSGPRLTKPDAFDGFHHGGVFHSNSPTREGLALLRDGERVLSPSQTNAFDAGRLGGGGGNVTINYSSFGTTPYNAMQEIKRAASDSGI